MGVSLLGVIVRNGKILLVLSICAVASVFLAFAFVYVFFDQHSYSDFLPSTQNVFLFVVSLSLVGLIRNPVSRLLYLVWAVWPVIGTLNIMANVLSDRFGNGKYAAIPEVGMANSIYCSFIIAFGVGVLLHERVKGGGFKDIGLERGRVCVLPQSNVSVLVVFPYMYMLSQSLSLGYIPIFSGVNITYNMYEVDYGALRFLKAWLLFSLIYAAWRAVSASSRQWKAIWWLQFLITVFISISDGKRRSAILALIALLSVYVVLSNGRFFTKRNAAFVMVIVISSISVTVLRSGTVEDFSTRQFISYFSFVGDTYWDFTKSINFYDVDFVRDAGYDFVRSSIASVLNSNLLSVFGVNKLEWVRLDSGNTWRILYDSKVGIRTGFVSELWYGFELYGYFVILVFGAALSALGARLLIVNSEKKIVFLLCIYALFFSAVNGQFSVLLGMATTLVYLYVFLFFVESVFGLIRGVGRRSS